MDYHSIRKQTLLLWNEFSHSPVFTIIILAADVLVAGYALYGIFENAEKNNLFEEYGQTEVEIEEQNRKKVRGSYVFVVAGIVNFLYIITRII